MEDKIEQEGGYIFCERDGVVSIEAEHFFAKQETEDAKWTIIPYMGRTLSGITLMPRLSKTDGTSLTYRMKLPTDVKQVKVHVIVKSTLAFARPEGHRYMVAMDGSEAKEIYFNHNFF